MNEQTENQEIWLKKISIIVPFYNEAENLPIISRKLVDVCGGLCNKCDYEIIFINDGSTDLSGFAIEEMMNANKKIKYLEFSRNFGKEVAISAGIHHSSGDAAIMLDADLQHPPELIPEFIEKWENGAEVVIGVRAKDSSDDLFKRLGSYFFYQISNWIGETKLVPFSTDFRLIDRKVIDEFAKLTERNRMARGLIAWLGFKREFINFSAPPRQYGRPRYGKLELIKLAMSSFVANSLLPLKLAGYLGMAITFISAIIGMFIIIDKYFFHDPFNFGFSGTAILMVFNLFLIGIVLSCLGVIALYIAKIHQEVSNRPLYIVSRKINFEK
ncbi:glycosyltransferase family 2 protein [Patescibacteria group bacterium]|nr:glycosyltransferase family 2 protein [Patescibacteria group bacterium]